MMSKRRTSLVEDFLYCQTGVPADEGSTRRRSLVEQPNTSLPSHHFAAQPPYLTAARRTSIAPDVPVRFPSTPPSTPDHLSSSLPRLTRRASVANPLQVGRDIPMSRSTPVVMVPRRSFSINNEPVIRETAAVFSQPFSMYTTAQLLTAGKPGRGGRRVSSSIVVDAVQFNGEEEGSLPYSPSLDAIKALTPPTGGGPISAGRRPSLLSPICEGLKPPSPAPVGLEQAEPEISEVAYEVIPEQEEDADEIAYLKRQVLEKKETVVNPISHDEMQFPTDTKLWYKEAVFYEVYVRAFCDSSGSGHGDLVGLTSKLDYLHSLGVDCLWLLPIYPSPLHDDGYDVADYVNIHPHYGNLDDFKALVSAVHERSMRVIIDFVPNHSSYMHEWFQKARSDRNSPYRDYYVWSDSPLKYKDARIIFIDTEPSNWTWDEEAGQYFWHRFYSTQPDLNFENPKVQEEMLKIMAFWLDLGVDGFRVDAVPYLFEEEGTNCENLPKTHEFLKRMRKFMDEHYAGRVLLSEACQPPRDVCKYFGDGDEFHMAFHFPVMPRIFMSIKSEDCTSLRDIILETPPIPETCQWVTFLRNHDELTLEMVTPKEREWMWQQYAPEKRMRLNLGIRRRLASLLNNDRRQIELAYCLLFTLPGSPIIYYGDELGMGDDIRLPDRNGVRTPMQWKADERNFGFSTADKSKLYSPAIADPVFGGNVVNVDNQCNDPSSLFHAIRHMILTRKKHPSCGTGKLVWVGTDRVSVVAYLRVIEHDWLLVICNLSATANEATVVLPEAYRPAHSPVLPEVLTSIPYVLDDDWATLRVSLNPYQFLWLDLQPLRA